MIPVRFATAMAMPVSMKGTVKSTTASLSELIMSDVTTMSVFLLTRSATKPFHLPVCQLRNRQQGFRIYDIPHKLITLEEGKMIRLL